jgi:hypothetical protein
MVTPKARIQPQSTKTHPDRLHREGLPPAPLGNRATPQNGISPQQKKRQSKHAHRWCTSSAAKRNHYGSSWKHIPRETSEQHRADRIHTPAEQAAASRTARSISKCQVQKA